MGYIDYEETGGLFCQQNLHPFAYIGHDESPLIGHKIGLRLELLSLRYLQNVFNAELFKIDICDQPRKGRFERRFGIPIEGIHNIDEYASRMESVLSGVIPPERLNVDRNRANQFILALEVGL